FLEAWLLSKLSWGNTYVLKARDDRGLVIALYVLNPQRVRPLVAPDGSVYYEVHTDHLNGLPVDAPILPVPASEMIHDRWRAAFQPLVGISPLYAAGGAANQALAMQTNSTAFYASGSQPSGLLVAPGQVSQDEAAAMSTYWNTNFSGANRSKVMVVENNIK